MNSFKELGIKKEVIKKLNENNITKPTLVQEKTIPLIIKGKDVLVQSETGSGKTISFAIPTIQQIKPIKEVQALIITPTRELAKQIANEYIKFAPKEVITTVVYGGVSLDKQSIKAKQSAIIVGTPGRLLDLLRRGAINLKKVKYLILDEADRMLDMGFINDINKIIKQLPKKKQSMMFSATINGRIRRLAEKYLNNHEIIILENTIKKGVLKQHYYDVEQRDKLPLLVKLIKENEGLSLVFCSTKRATEFVANTLKKNNINAACMNGNMTQNAREKVLKRFTTGDLGVLVATDVAARGIHVDDIKFVYNFDLPNDAETYTHRIGRTARQGKRGTAIIILSDRDYPKMGKIQTANFKSKIERRETPKLERIKIPPRKKERYNNKYNYKRKPNKSFRKRY